MYFGHHLSTIEGGMVCTNDSELFDILLMIRSHGWSRDLSSQKQKELQAEWNVNDFNNLYTFYYPGFNLRATDLQAKIGLGQLDKADAICENRNKSFNLYKKYINNNQLELPVDEDNFISDLVHNKIKEKRILEKNNEKLVKGATKIEIEREIINKENEIIGLKAILVGNLIDKKNNLNNFPILERYTSLVNNDNIGTLSKLLSILVNSNQLHNSLDLITFKLLLGLPQDPSYL
jgi:hypothetical protein